MELLRKQSENFDLIFLDCDKYLYPKAFPVVLEKLKTGGLLVT
ncbi:O-methyltransferase, partial [bacterium]|nr:O-methyltransferase [bacterium]